MLDGVMSRLVETVPSETLPRLIVLILCLAVSGVAWAAPEATLFRLFLRDGGTVVSYGEYVRLEHSVVFSLPVGGTADKPRLQVTSLPSDLVDWPRTERYAASARYQRYAATRGEEDYERLTAQVAAALSGIAEHTDPLEALALAERARQLAADWPGTRLGYRGEDISEILGVLDDAISSLRAATGSGAFDLAFVALPLAPPLEPVLGMPGIHEQLDQIFRLAALSSSPSEKMALLEAALARVSEVGPELPPEDAAIFRHAAEARLRDERETNRRYTDLARRLMARALRAAGEAKVSDVQGVIAQVPREDDRLGQRRPAVIESLTASLSDRLSDARILRLRRDQWALRLPIYREYERVVGSSVELLVDAIPALDAIRSLEGPDPERLVGLRAQLAGGAEYLERVGTPAYLREVHERLIGAWRFAESAASGRFDAVSEVDPAAAWQASSSAAGALMMITRVQQDLRAIMEPPTLQ
jgi:hypothetical protein